MMPRCAHPPAGYVPPAAGFTLIEVLVALTVLAFGLLGAAAMQVTSLRDTQSADTRSVALFLAYDIIDRIHANRYSCKQGTAAPVGGGGTSAGFPGDCYDLMLTPTAYTSSFTVGTASPTAPSTSCFGTSASCTAAALSMFDLWTWQQNVAAQLPRGEGVVCNTSTPTTGVPSWAAASPPGTKGSSLYGCDGLAATANACLTCGASAPVLTVKIWWDDRIGNSAGGQASDRANGATSAATFRRLYLSFEP